MNLTFPLLTADQIEVKVKQVNKPNANGIGAVSLLLYKTARTDMDILDAVVGPLNWQDDYREIKGNLYCGIGIRDHDEHGERMVWKWDCGTESRKDDEGNQKKGEASDAFKRAGFKWGIGRELYTGPKITAFLPVEMYRDKPVLKDNAHKYGGFSVSAIAYNDMKISELSIVDANGIIVFEWTAQKGACTPRQNWGKGNDHQGTNQRRDEAQNAPPAADNVGRTVTICEKCGKPIKGFMQDGKTYNVSDVISWSQGRYGKSYCYRCYNALRSNPGEAAS